MSNQDNGRQFQQSKKTGVYHGKDEINHGEYNGNRLEVLDCRRFFMLGQPVERQEDRITKQSGANQRKQNLLPGSVLLSSRALLLTRMAQEDNREVVTMANPVANPILYISFLFM